MLAGIFNKTLNTIQSIDLSAASADMDLRNRNNVTLKEKLQQRYDERKKEGFAPSPGFLNRWAPIWYIVVLLGVAYWGLFDALPSIYGSWEPVWLQINTCFCCLVFLEMMTNWVCIHLVDSSYNPSLHGTQPNVVDTHVRNSNSDVVNNDVTLTVPVNENGHQNGTNFKMYVATGVSATDGSIKRSAYPYWSWVPCLVCKWPRPPRCHHCSLCNKCVLKRDHHCFFARACIGVHNQRHFMVFLFWAFLGTAYSMVHMVPYFLYDVYPRMIVADICPPVAFVRAILGYQNYNIGILMSFAWGLVLFTMLNGQHFHHNLKLIKNSLTSFEEDHDIKIVDSRGLGSKLRSVFGEYWAVNFLVPLHRFYKPIEDPVLWPTIKP